MGMCRAESDGCFTNGTHAAAAMLPGSHHCSITLPQLPVTFVACLLQGALPLGHAATGLQRKGPEAAKLLPRGGGYEPTMTISTKAAFDAINQMFKVTGHSLVAWEGQWLRERSAETAGCALQRSTAAAAPAPDCSLLGLWASPGTGLSS